MSSPRPCAAGVVRPAAGGRLTTAAGVLAIDSVDELADDSLTEDDARAAGHASLEAARAALARRPGGRLYRIRFRLEGPDPRLELRERIPEGEALDDVVAGIARLDRACSTGPWVESTLDAIATHPGLRAASLAAMLGRDNVHSFKTDVRKLKARGLTISLEVGYRLSPRGERLLAALRRR